MEQKTIIGIIVLTIIVLGVVFAYMLKKKQQVSKEKTETVFRQSGTSVTSNQKPLNQNLVCPAGSYVSGFYGFGGQSLDQMGVVCSNGQNLGTIGSKATNIVNWKVENPDGFDTAIVTSGQWIDGIQIVGKDNQVVTAGGNGGSGSKRVLLRCPNGKIMGINAASGAYVDNLQFVCGSDQPVEKYPGV